MIPSLLARTWRGYTLLYWYFGQAIACPLLTGPCFSPVGHMTDLIYAEKDLVQSLKEYILVEEAKLSKIKRCLMS